MRTYYQIRFKNGTYAPQNFNTLKEAVAFHATEYLKSDKRDGYDTYHRTRKAFFEKVETKTTTMKIFKGLE